MIEVFRKGRKLPILVEDEELGRVAGDNSIWVWYGPSGPEVVFRDEPEEEPEEE